MGRAPCCDKANVKRGPWSPDEDDTLKSYIQTHGTGGNWIALPHKIGLKRCGKSCRLRWLNYLRPNIKHGGFTEDEDNLICSLYISIGSRWSIIAAQLPGRTDNDIKNYWNTRLRKKLLGRQRREQRAIESSQNHHQPIINIPNNNFMSVYPAPPAPFLASTNNSVISFDSTLAVQPTTFPCYDDISNNDQNLNCYTGDQMLLQYQQFEEGPQFSNYVPTFDHNNNNNNNNNNVVPMPHQEHELLMESVVMMDRWPGDVSCLVYPSLC